MVQKLKRKRLLYMALVLMGMQIAYVVVWHKREVDDSIHLSMYIKHLSVNYDDGTLQPYSDDIVAGSNNRLVFRQIITTKY